METERLAPIRSLAAELRRQADTKVDVVADTRRVSFGAADDAPLALLVDMPGEGLSEYGVTRHAHQQIAEHLGVPWKFYERLLDGTGNDHSRKPRSGAHRDLLANLANGLLSREPAKRMIRTLDGTARAFLSDKYLPRDNYQLVEALLPVLEEYPGVQYLHCELTEKRMYIKLVAPWIEKPVTPKEGDTVRGGLVISNSEIGDGSLYIYPWSHRLICLNGAIHEDFGERRIHVGRRLESEEEAYRFYTNETLQLEAEAFFAKCADTVRGCLNEEVFDAIVGQMRELADIHVGGSPVDMVEDVTRRFGFTEKEGGSILEHLIEAGDLSAWGYVNGVTATARDLTDADRCAELEMVAGRMIANPDVWLAGAAVMVRVTKPAAASREPALA